MKNSKSKIKKKMNPTFFQMNSIITLKEGKHIRGLSQVAFYMNLTIY